MKNWMVLWVRYRGELYAVLVSVTEGDAKGILKGMADRAEKFEGLKCSGVALMLRRQRLR